LALQDKRAIYGLLFRASAETLLTVGRDPQRLGAELGFFSVLHTWNQQLLHHPHIHCVVPAGGLAPDHTRWIAAPSHFFLPVKVLSRVFRGKFVAGLRELHRSGKLTFCGKLAQLREPKSFATWIRSLFRSDWVVYSKRPFGGAEHVLHYLGAYTHRVAISNHRLVALADGRVTFRWRDSAQKNKQRLAQLPVMSSCAVFCCMSCRAVSCASATSDSWHTAGAPHSCRVAWNCSPRKTEWQPIFA
jgi:hypothetical protein